MEMKKTAAQMLEHLPQELTSVIFEYTLPDKPSFSSSKPPLALPQVCRSWRSIALNTPRLWSRFTIPDWQELPKDILKLVRLYLDRAGETPLDVDISMFNEDVMVFPDSDKLKDLRQLLRDLLKELESRRAKIARFKGVFPDFLMKDVGVPEMINAEHIYYCGMLGDRLAMDMELEGLEEDEFERRMTQYQVDGHFARLDIGSQRESLKFLAICGCSANIDSVRLQTQLTHLELTDLHRGGELCQETAFTLLQNMPNLKSCVLDLTRFERQDWSAPEERLVLSNVELLFLSWTFPADIEILLRIIAAPKLKKFGLRGTPMVAERPWRGLHDFLEASKPPIERISLGDFSAVDAQLLRCFEYIPTLVHLTVNHAEIHDIVFRTLTCTDSELYNSALLPNLQIFNMGVCEGFSLDCVVAFLKSRAAPDEDAVRPEGVSRLTEAAIMYCQTIEERHAPLLRECGVQNLILEAAEDDSVYPYARVVETHRELLAVLYQADGEDELPPFPDFDEEEVDEEVQEAESHARDGDDEDEAGMST